MFSSTYWLKQFFFFFFYFNIIVFVILLGKFLTYHINNDLALQKHMN